jgi:hypothetical protein
MKVERRKDEKKAAAYNGVQQCRVREANGNQQKGRTTTLDLAI